MSRCLLLLLPSGVAIATMRPAAQSTALFTFHSNPWIAEHWTPRLDGKRSVGDSLSALVASFK